MTQHLIKVTKKMHLLISCVYLDQPLFYHASSFQWPHVTYEPNFFSFSTLHCCNKHITRERKPVNSFEAFLQMRLHTKWILRLRKNFEKFVIRQKEESGEKQSGKVSNNTCAKKSSLNIFSPPFSIFYLFFSK